MEPVYIGHCASKTLLLGRAWLAPHQGVECKKKNTFQLIFKSLVLVLNNLFNC